MSLNTWYKFRIYCNSESTWKELYSNNDISTVSRKCPYDSSHSVVAESIQEIDRREENEIKIAQESSINRTGGRYKRRGYKISVPANSSASQDHTYVNDMGVSTIEYESSGDQKGNSFCVFVAPETALGAIGSDLSIGDNQIVLNTPGTIESLELGFTLEIKESGITHDCGEITAIDTKQRIITFENSVQQAFSSSTPTLAYFSVHMIVNNPIGGIDSHIKVGEDSLGSSYHPKGRVVRIVYRNETNSAVDFYYWLNHYYGGVA